MKKPFMRYSLFSGATVAILFALEMIIFSGPNANYSVSEYAGYASIIISLCFVYFGIRYYRDKQNNGTLSFWQGIKTGMLITLVPSVCFGLLDVVYVALIDPNFYEKYEQIMLARLKASVPPEQFAVKAAEMKKQAEFFSKPIVDFLLMAVTVAAIGLIITVISTFVLKRAAATKTIVEFA